MNSGAVSRFLWWSVKVGTFGGALYLVTTNGLWSSNREYSSIKAIQDIRETADRKLGTQYLSQISMPKLNVAAKWNYGVSKSFDYAADLPEKSMKKFNDGLKYVHEKLK